MSASFFIDILFIFAVLFLTILAAVGLCLLVRQIEDVGELLLDRGDAARVLALDHVGDFLWKL
jgi:Mg2+/citrate symporter